MFFLANIIERYGYAINLIHKDNEHLTLEGMYQDDKTSGKVLIRKESLSTVTQLFMAANYCIANGVNVHMDYLVDIHSHDTVNGYLGLLTDEDAYQTLNIDLSTRDKDEFEVLLLAPPCINGAFNGLYVGKKVNLHHTAFNIFNPDYEEDHNDQ
ncbi:hypothetical protein [Paenibacillus sp. QZ-Y1]|uniref:hypothetical protein n=1 Tax=Paenibacillus sp. QZ-Y1 TaxID=3414511 RepID=UPI003F7B2531